MGSISSIDQFACKSLKETKDFFLTTNQSNAIDFWSIISFNLTRIDIEHQKLATLSSNKPRSNGNKRETTGIIPSSPCCKNGYQIATIAPIVVIAITIKVNIRENLFERMFIHSISHQISVMKVDGFNAVPNFSKRNITEELSEAEEVRKK